MGVNLYPHQKEALKLCENQNKVAFYHDMGTGKTFTGAEKMIQLGESTNLVICQKSKIADWKEHFENNYDWRVVDLTNKKEVKNESFFPKNERTRPVVYLINYELVFRRPELLKLTDFTLMLDESSLIQNEKAKRTKFILKMKPKNIILLSGTPTSGKYERLWSQMHLLGWNISKDLYWKQYVDFYYLENQGFPIKVVNGYKNVDRLKEKMHELGCQFLKTDEIFDLPEQIFQDVNVDVSKDYKKFRKDRVITIDDKELVGDTVLTKMLYERMLCGSYSKNKIEALKDLLSSTEDRVLIFYNFNDELRVIEDICIELDKPMSIVNGQEKDLTCYEEYENSVTAIQYQAGSMGLNLQRSNRMIFFSPTLSCEMYMQSKKRIHRIGQSKSCFYYKLICRGSIEEKIYKALERGIDYTEKLFEKDDN